MFRKWTRFEIEGDIETVKLYFPFKRYRTQCFMIKLWKYKQEPVDKYLTIKRLFTEN